MTRFNISLTEGVAMVVWALQNGLGGEIFIPKIPSYRVIDLAKAIGPDCGLDYVGIRPGEKLHESLLTESDSYNTIDIGQYYAILPSSDELDVDTYRKRWNGAQSSRDTSITAATIQIISRSTRFATR